MVVLSMITKDSLTKVGDKLGEVLDSTRQIPYKLFVLVDDSKDDTAKFVRERLSDKEVVVLRTKAARPSRGAARQTAIDYFLQHTSDEWLMFIDDDVILRNGWWEEAQRYMAEPRVGLIWGVELTEFWEDRLRYIRARGIDPIQYSILNFKIRGGTHDTLLRRGAIEGVKIPEWNNFYDDAWIKRYVECRGYEYRIVMAGAVHLRREGASGYSRRDFELMPYVDALLRLQNVGVSSFLKALFGLPGYLYYGWKSGSNGFEMWKTRVVYRWKILRTAAKCRLKPCDVVLRYEQVKRDIATCVPKKYRHIFE
ncbi:glycosyl transferase, family 2 [Pyrobaculum islandicum DSM 4184]|uniref:Glycosyl transferase, family 2 n=1 Tax=Pyrobaculum islandicum (strain DSM 4184 / JCM 9189 / GEO3) TaxID=384616 RepID=A1RUJ2_PYRIL|nr:glycosyltransferase [Pyrobaculum islandicum]ABL88624.1 glycosyl transferase, family 2 [Pyrobaculum islandicum DSM 4184]